MPVTGRAAAEAAIARLEAEGKEQIQRLAETQRSIEQLRIDLDQARTADSVAAARASEQEQRATISGVNSIWPTSTSRA
jgi:hypothetical protein